MKKKNPGTEPNQGAGAARKAETPASPEQAARVERLKRLIQKGEYDTHEKINAILDGFIKDLV